MSRGHKNYDYDDDYGDYDDYDDQGDEGYGEGNGDGYEEEETVDYVALVRSKLPKGTRIAEDAIIAHLEVNDYNVKHTIKAIESQLAKKKTPAAAAAAGAAGKSAKPGSGGPAPAGSKPSSKPKAGAASAAKGATTPGGSTAQTSSALQTGKPSEPGLETVFTKAVSVAESASAEPAAPQDLQLSDTESSKSAAHEVHPKPTLTMVVVGHVDAGKSTLVGHLVHKLGQVNARAIDKLDKQSKSIGKSSFAYAWVMDERQSEREHGVTIDLAERKIDTPNYSFIMLDSPGHRDFVPNMIKGAAQADVALLVVPATAGEFESALSAGAQTREHAVLLKALGVGQIIVVVNKMDGTRPEAWSHARFCEIEETMRKLLVQELQFNDSSLRFVPVSGLTGENLVGISEGCALKSWYTESSLVAALDSFHLPPRPVDKPFRARATEIDQGATPGHARIGSGASGIYSMTVLQGSIGIGRSVGVAKCSAGRVHLYTARVVALSENPLVAKRPTSATSEAGELACAVARDKVFVQLCQAKQVPFAMELEGDEELLLFKGPVLPSVNRRFTADILTLSTLTMPIIPGSTFELYLKGVEMQCTIAALLSVAGSTSKRPKCVAGGKSASITIEVCGGHILIDTFAVCRALGRFALRSKGSTVAVGIVHDVSEK